MADPPEPRGETGPDPDLAAALRALGSRLDVPPTPDLRAAVRARLAAAPGVAPVRLVRVRPARLGPSWSERSTRAAAVVAALALLIAGTLAASPRARAAVLDFVTFGAVRVHSGPAPVPAPAGSRFDGLPDTRATTLDVARREAAFPVGVPAALGAPDQVLVRIGADPDLVALRYGPGPGRPAADRSGISIELDEFAAAVGPYLDKYLGSGGAERVAVGADRGLWVDGPHEVAYVDHAGTPRSESARLAGRTLIWQHGDVTFRLEGDLGRAQAVAIALSIG